MGVAQLHREPLPSVEALLERARAMKSWLADRAQATEHNRSVLPDTIEAFRAAGFYRICQPAAYGGYEMSPRVLFEVAMELAQGCPSSAWCLCLVAVHNWEVALLDPQVAEDLWSHDNEIRISSSYAPFGKVERVDGGFHLSGRWPWSSGCDHCQWAMLGGIVPTDPGAPKDVRSFLVPRSDYAIDDTWHVLGLKGTGSKDVVIEHAFVPAYRTHEMALSATMTEPGRGVFSSRSYGYSFGMVFAYCLSSVALGMAEGALRLFVGQMQQRLDALDGAPAINDPFVRQRLAEADSIVRGLRHRFGANFDELDAAIASGQPLPIDLRVRNKWEAQTIAKDAMRAIEMLFKASGGRGVRLENPMQRFFRDVHTASNHAFLNADKGSLNAGGVLMGAAPCDWSF